MNTHVITIKVDPVTKKQAQHIASELGLSLSAVLKGLLKQFIVTKTVTFSPRSEEIPNAHTRKVLKQAEENYRKDKASPTFDNAKDAIAYLHKQGV